MDGLAIRQQDNTKVSAAHLVDPIPAPNTSVRLDFLALRGEDDLLDPR
jgi:hypothetical protein